ncbi:HAMP domain-containing histidine kinase [Kribbella sp. NBC_01245]|uniref:sensor histidine kinase n=1 Tax=Kribbella sp. NBC_01245 TaxID=2903578 RepID=UPI002E29EF64|nr:HAMP domain-containing sensor histidine kinase [Kribbella sp. NBC_01245]
MSAISSRAPEPLTAPAVSVLRPGAALAVDLGLAAFVVAMVGLMVALPGREAAPFHWLFVALSLAYGLVMVWHARRRATALRQVEELAARQLAGLDREREFFRDASHAIRTPVTIARGHLELATGSELPDGVRQDLIVALQQLERMSALSNRLLALARLDAGEALRCQPTDLAELVGRIGRNWSASADRDWRIRNEPTGVVSLDPEWIALAVDALVENAVHFTADGGTITVGCQALDTTCTITVTDSGPGIDAEDLSKVFDRFWHRMPPNGQMGSGLGLSMAHATAAAHGGALAARNHPLGGAVFELTLPRPAQAT